MPKKNPHQKTINALIRKLNTAEAKRDKYADECNEIAAAIKALGGDPSVDVAAEPNGVDAAAVE